MLFELIQKNEFVLFIDHLDLFEKFSQMSYIYEKDFDYHFLIPNSNLHRSKLELNCNLKKCKIIFQT